MPLTLFECWNSIRFEEKRYEIYPWLISWVECFWIFNFKARHEPVELLPGKLSYFKLVTWLTEFFPWLPSFYTRVRIHQIPKVMPWYGHNIYRRLDKEHSFLDPYVAAVPRLHTNHQLTFSCKYGLFILIFFNRTLCLQGICIFR